MKKIIFLIAFNLLILPVMNASVPNEVGNKGIISGQVIDSLSHDPVEYATVAIYLHDSRKLISGVISDLTGSFRFKGLDFATYDIEISFIGYQDMAIKNIQLSKSQSFVDLGKLHLQRSALNLKEVEIVDGTPAVEYKIDRKVIHVDQQITAISGTAVDILESVPSVSVDLEGNVTLRGSSGFTVLIDGKPSVLEASDILNQIPASSIADIEIITNPSAKYDPDGTAGIINIKMKKIKLEGLNGVMNANLGQYNAYGGDFLLNYKKEKFNLYFGADYNRRSHPGTMTNERMTTKNDTIYHTNSIGDRDRHRTSWNVRTGVELNLSKLDYANLGFNVGDHSHGGTSVSNYDEWNETQNIHNLYTSNEDENRSGKNYSINFDYKHQFGHPTHELALQAIYDGRLGDEISTNELINMDGRIENGQRSTESGPMARLRLKADYARPILENNKLEAGYQSIISRSKDINTVDTFNVVTNQYELLPEYGHTSLYNDDVHAVYATFSGEANKFGYMAGLRGEYTNRKMELQGENTQFTLDRFDYFPSLHISYQLPKNHQLIASYSRRIERPRGYFLEPFITIEDAYNVRRGNPNLLPEYIDSYELGYQKNVNKSFVSLDAYYRITHNKIERVSSVYKDNIMMQTFENVGSDYSLGLELMLNLDVIKWWRMELMGNLFDYTIKGTLYDAPYSQNSLSWTSRLNNTFYAGEFTKIQFNGNYNSPRVSAQGKREGYYMMNAAVSRDFFKRKLTVVAQLRDVFSTAKYQYTSQGPDFYNYRQYERKSPFLMVSLTYKINNYKVKREKLNGGSGMDVEGEE
jgi:outer membrane receptor protein involved in Fe transport